MLYNTFADLVMLLHGVFVLFVVLGGFLALWKPMAAWIHIPAVFWGAGIEFFGWTCPLTNLEFMLRQRGGSEGYGPATGFIEHYVGPILYPAYLSRNIQVGFGLTVLLVNAGVYLTCWNKRRRAGSGKT